MSQAREEPRQTPTQPKRKRRASEILLDKIEGLVDVYNFLERTYPKCLQYGTTYWCQAHLVYDEHLREDDANE